MVTQRLSRKPLQQHYLFNGITCRLHSNTAQIFIPVLTCVHKLVILKLIIPPMGTLIYHFKINTFDACVDRMLKSKGGCNMLHLCNNVRTLNFVTLEFVVIYFQHSIEGNVDDKVQEIIFQCAHSIRSDK